MTRDTGAFTIGTVTEVPLYEGRKNRNSHCVEVTVDGATYKVWRRQTGAIKLPLDIRDHSLAAAIKTAVSNAILGSLMPGIEAGRAGRGR